METLTRLPTHLGAALRRERRRRKLTQTQLGEKVRLRQATISSVESGDDGTQLSTIFRILSALDLELVVRPRTKEGPDDFLKVFKRL